MSYSLGQVDPRSVPGAVELVVSGVQRDPAANTYTNFAEALDAMGIATRKYAGRSIALMSPPGSNRKVADLEAGTGKPRMLHGIGAAGQYRYSALGDTLTDWACDQSAYTQGWRERVRSGLNSGAQAALIGGVAAGLLGGLLKRPVLGAAIGGVTGWAAHAIWTAPLAP